MEKIGSDLSKLGDKPAEGYMLAQALLALKHLADHYLVHADLKPGNILHDSDNRRIVIADLGMAAEDPPSGSGTLEYMSPLNVLKAIQDHFRRVSSCDAIQQLFKGVKVGYSRDVWALAMTMIELALKRLCVRFPLELKDEDRGIKYLSLMFILNKMMGTDEEGAVQWLCDHLEPLAHASSQVVDATQVRRVFEGVENSLRMKQTVSSNMDQEARADKISRLLNANRPDTFSDLLGQVCLYGQFPIGDDHSKELVCNFVEMVFRGMYDIELICKILGVK
jgi:serine/threonine protein kinase